MDVSNNPDLGSVRFTQSHFETTKKSGVGCFSALISYITNKFPSLHSKPKQPVQNGIAERFSSSLESVRSGSSKASSLQTSMAASAPCHSMMSQAKNTVDNPVVILPRTPESRSDISDLMRGNSFQQTSMAASAPCHSMMSRAKNTVDNPVVSLPRAPESRSDVFDLMRRLGLTHNSENKTILDGLKFVAKNFPETSKFMSDSLQNHIAPFKTSCKGYKVKDNVEARKYGIEKKNDEKQHKIRQNFSMIYQSNAGCKAINIEARHQFRSAPSAGKLSGNNVVEEYRRVHGYEIFDHGNKALKTTIKAICSNLSELVNTGAKAWYTPTEKNITTYRGQGITLRGIDKLISQFDADKQNNTETVYNLGQFFSTSKDQKVASDFAERSPDDAKVIFKVKGNSSKGLSISDGLSFNKNEGERLYSPLANFKVTAVSRAVSNTYHVTLEEVTKCDKAKLLPY